MPENAGAASVARLNDSINFGITSLAAERIMHLRRMENTPSAMLRILIYAGGCSGFKYHLELTESVEADDQIISYDNKDLVVMDNQTLHMLQGGVLDFVDEVSGSYFKILNPNAQNSCGCGNSFS